MHRKNPTAHASLYVSHARFDYCANMREKNSFIFRE